MNIVIPNRAFFAITGIGCIGLLSYGYYLQFFEDLVPCPMCIFQRLCYMAIATVALAAVIQGPARRGGIIYCALLAVFAAIGGSIAGRQTWLQHLPPELVPECGPGLDFMLEMYPLLETIKNVLIGTGDCAEVTWTFLSLSIAEWSVFCFSGIFVAAVWQLISNRRHTTA